MKKDTLREFFSSILSKDKPLSSILNLCLLNSPIKFDQNFKIWLNYESTGYPAGVEIPYYRKMNTELFADVTYTDGETQLLPLDNINNDESLEEMNRWEVPSSIA